MPQCGLGVLDEWRGVCECPMGFAGAHCEQALLPDCMLAGHAIPVRSWVLHAFHNRAGIARWAGRPGPHPIGPVPCACLRQFVAEPFLLERTRLQYMRGFSALCVHLPTELSLDAFLANPMRGAESYSYWRAFSFGAAHDALRLGVEPVLHAAPLDAERPELASLVRHALRAQKGGGGGLGRSRFAGYHIDALRPYVPSCLRRAAVKHIPPIDPLPLLPLALCPHGCGGRGWCEPSRSGRPR